MTRILHIIYIELLATLMLTACGADRNLKRGEKYLALGEYYDAGNEFKQAYQKTEAKNRDKRGRIAQRMAFCNAKSLQTQKGIAAMRNAQRYGHANADDLLLMGQMLMKNGNYKDAAEVYRAVLDSLPDSELARTGLKAAQEAPQIKELGSRYTVKKMDVFNSRRADYCPMLAGDYYEQLYFTTTRNETEGDELSGITGAKPGDIFVSEKDDKGKWGKPEQVQGGLNTDYDEGASCLSSDGREMYLTQCSTDPSYPRYAKLVKSSRNDAAWGKVTEVTLTADTLSSFAHPALSPDGTWLYFVSDMPGGKGGLDIWRVRIVPGGYGGVENLGDPINTEGDEMFPSFRPNGDFYFSSTGHGGLGGLDIFIAKVGKDNRYHLSHPGYPLNSQGDDFGMTFEGPYNRGYFSSNRGDGRGFDHIYSFENPEIVQTVKGWVYEMDGYELPAAQVYCVGDDGTNEHLSVRSDGSFTKVLDEGVSYLFLATCKGFLNHREEVTALTNPKESRDTTLQFALANISAPTLIDNIFYDFDKATLRDSSKTALDKLVGLLNENPNITIELAAHTDYKGSNKYNESLSQRRAESVVNYLIAHGIAADRLTPKGYGEERPKKMNRKAVEKHPWLKEGDELTESFITALKNEKKEEECNQLNRRTEFQVLRTTYGLFDEKGNLKQLPKPRKPEQKEDLDPYGTDIIFY